MAMMKPDEIEDVVLASCQKLSSIFQEFPMQKKDLMMPHGIIPLMDMLDVNNNRVRYFLYFLCLCIVSLLNACWMNVFFEIIHILLS